MDVLAVHWWAVAARGVAALLFGLAALLLPDITLTLLTALFGGYALLDGLFGVASVGNAIQRREVWWVLLEGLVGIAAGMVALFFPEATALVLFKIVGAWATVTGALQVVQAARLRSEIRNGWLIALAGAVSLAFGVYVFIAPRIPDAALLWTVGGYGIVFGIILIALGISLRAAHGEWTPG